MMNTAANVRTPDTRPEEAELLRHLRQFIALRWVAVAGILASAAAAQSVFAIQVALAPILATSAGVAKRSAGDLANMRSITWANASGTSLRNWRTDGIGCVAWATIFSIVPLYAGPLNGAWPVKSL